MSRLLGACVLVGSAIAHPALIRAQTARDSTLTLEHALRIAEAHAPRLQARASDVRGARDAVTLSNEALLPSVDAGGQVLRATDNNVTGLLFPQPVILSVSGPVRPSASGATTYGSAFGVALSWSPITFGRVDSQRRQARAALSLARDNLTSTLFDERSRVAAAYLDLLTAQELVRVQQQAVTRTQAAARSVRALAASGLRPGVDSLLVIADLSRAQIDLISARRNAVSAKSQFAELLGTPNQLPPLEGSRFLENVPDAAAMGTAPPADLSGHPRIQPFVAQVAVSEARRAVAAHASLPRLSVVAGLSARGSGIASTGSVDGSSSGGLSPVRSNTAVGLMFSVPMLDVLFTGPRAGVEQGRLDADRFELAAQEDHLRSQLTAADTNMMLAGAAAREVPNQLAAATAGYQQTNSRYSAGLSTLAELAQAQYLVTRAEGDAIVTRIAAWRAWLDQCTARGDLGPFLMSVR